MRHSGLTAAVLAAALAVATATPAVAAAEGKRIQSVKSLTHLLNQVEQEHGEPARFVTMKLQLYLEDVYISQGTTVTLRPTHLSRAIGALLASGRTSRDAARQILRMYQDGDFHE